MGTRDYHYTECGLDNVIVTGAGFDVVDDNGERIVEIPAVGMLHKAIAEGLINQNGALGGQEIRFLRTELGMTQAELAKLLHRDTQSVGRWERNKCPIEPTQDMTLRQITRDRLKVNLPRDTEALSAIVTPQSPRRHHDNKLRLSGMKARQTPINRRRHKSQKAGGEPPAFISLQDGSGFRSPCHPYRPCRPCQAQLALDPSAQAFQQPSPRW